MAESIVQIQWAYSNKRQAAYATRNPDVDIDQSHPFEGADIADHVPNMSDNAALLGKGHEFATRNEILSWDVRFRRSFIMTSKIAGWAFAFHCGKVTTVNLGGSPVAYSHVFEYQDPVGAGFYGSGRQQPAVTIVERVASGLARRFPSCQVMSVEVTGQLADWTRIALDMIGSGKKEDASGFTFPDSTNPATGGEGLGLLRNAGLLFMHGPSGGVQVDLSCDVRSFRFRSEMSFFETDGYCPGSGYQISGDPTSGQIRNKLEFGRRAVMLEFVVNASSTTFHTRLEASALTSAVLTTTGAVISGANAHLWRVNVPQVKYKSVPIGTDGDQVIYTVTAVIFYDQGLANPFEVTVVNTTPSYLVSS